MKALLALMVAATLLFVGPSTGINRGDKTTRQVIQTGTASFINIRGVTEFRSNVAGTRRLAMYVNVNLPSDRAKREALSRGGWTAWFDYDKGNVTGLLGPVPFPRFGGTSMLITHTWDHGVQLGETWRFGIKVDAYDSAGRPMRFPLTLTTRNVRVT